MGFKLMLIVAVTIVGPSLSHWHGHDHHVHSGPHHGHHSGSGFSYENMKQMHDRLFERIARDLNNLDEEVRRSCSRHSNGQTREVVEEGRYVVSAPLAGYEEAQIEVKIRGRVLYISAHNPAGVHAHYTEVRTLPTFVSVTSAQASYDGTVLSVAFAVEAEASTCSAGADANLAVSVPVAPEALLPLDARGSFGNQFSVQVANITV